ncbi:MAG: DUF3443 domain-containing protein [Steroidobacteraceae bacterium]
MCAALCAALLSCGGGGGDVASSGSGSSGSTTPSGSNVVDVVVDTGPTTSNPDTNTLFTTVTVCVPGSTTECQTIDHIQVDTGSFGLRILSSVLSVSLPLQTTASNTTLLECTGFVDGYSWGPVALADVQISGESASSVPVQVIGDANFTALVPTACSSIGPAEDTVAAFGANGIIGIGPFAQDCGSGCVSTVDNGDYYACTSTLCEPTAVALDSQVPNLITMFAADNNGVIIQMPSVASTGATTVSGYMIFGIDTESNNKSGSQTVLTLNESFGEFTTVFNGQSLTASFLDTGSNGLYFNDSSLTACTASGLTDFYCPTSTQTLTAQLQGQTADGQAGTTSVNESFSVNNPESYSADDAAVPGLAGTYPGTTSTFDWGLPFYYGRTVYTAIEGGVTSVGAGPYVAF